MFRTTVLSGVKTKKLPRIEPIRVELAGGESFATVFYAPHDTGRAFVGATGFGATSELYFDLAAELARQGFHVIIPDIHTPLKGEDPSKTLEFKARRIAMAIELLVQSVDIDELNAFGHSFGGPCVVEAANQLTTHLDSIHLVSSVGFGGVINQNGTLHVGQVPGFYAHELLGAARHPSRFLGATALRRQLELMSNIPQRVHEIREIQSLPDTYMTQKLPTLPLKTRVYVADRDHVVHPEPTRRAVADVVSIHRNATHFAPTTHGRHVAHQLTA